MTNIFHTHLVFLQNVLSHFYIENLIFGEGIQKVSLGMPPFQKSAVFLNIVQTGGGGVNPCSKIMSEIVVCSGGHLTT